MTFGKFRLSLLYFTIILIVFGIVSVPGVNAQSSSSILVNVAPPNPAPYENVSISLSSYADNLDTVSITWSVNGKEVSAGIGKKYFSATAGAAGSETNVIATIELPAGVTETRITLRPAVMTLLWQANDSYVPPFYRGKAMPTPGSEIKVVAIPEIKNIGEGLDDAKNMTYTWRKDYANDQEGSGYGKNFFLYINDYLEDSNNISVTASTIDQKYESQASIDIGTIQPKILFYKNDGKLGTIWDQALTNIHRITNSEILVAIPYFISPKEIRNPRLVWNWSINDNVVNVSNFRNNFIPLQVQTGISGTSRLRLEIENKNKIFQTVNKEINIEF
ncbi:hypothetical protein A2818_00130 [Candidatus Nomurabacteria bacterium RIFCSPHIGHO2_01_FULL_40_12]|uniref:Uncharacterized protein n=1 Tax=Candidatus Nomurabacteria bacterium RIFCSPHIGHO2_01_FULL_40_12 TaxID=1801737 RepID=A0A1F6V0L2_9BACT|nr:MAG: hypothetical protein A2818_00130 [Candidatus Nomurabacteria bacterium RIFCSPHIGHO2_01_FULL_40_12]